MIKRKLSDINEVVAHCSASESPAHDNIETITRWHVVERKFEAIGYHYVITKDGQVHIGRSLDLLGAHCEGWNKNSIGVCLTGYRVFSEAQFEALRALVQDLMKKLKIMRVVGHNYHNPHKECPVYDVKTVLKGIIND